LVLTTSEKVRGGTELILLGATLWATVRIVTHVDV
jgi:hypothetical protein